jgi:plasmid maintenance system antidote protein VapI
MENERKELSDRLRKVLREKMLSVTAFSKKVGMNQMTCNRQVNGENAMSLEMIMKTLRLFPDISADWLLLGDGAEYRNMKPVQVVKQTSPEESETVQSLMKELAAQREMLATAQTQITSLLEIISLQQKK